MSLTSLIKGEFKDFFKEIIPTKKEFKTFSGTRAFSKDYIEHVEYKLENPYNSGVIGTAFDYLARWLIAKNINGEKKDAYSNLVAQNGIKYCEIIAQQNKKGSIRKRYDNGINCVELFVNGSNNKVQTIKTAIFFAKLDRIWRSGTHIIDIEKLLEVEEEVFTDLVALIDVFQTKFIDSGVVTETSIVVYNPSFGGASYLCGGADADIYIDGTLYDFKCTKKVGYVWNEVAQILGYYLLDNISKGNNDPTNDLGECEIKRIAFYKARFGEIEYYDVSKENYLNAIEQLAEMLGKDKYREYFDKIKKREEEDRKRRAFEEEYKNVERIHRKLLKYTKSEFFFNHLKKCNDSTECLETMKIHIEVC